MASKATITRRNLDAMRSIETSIEKLAGEKPAPNLKVRHRQRDVQDMLRFEALAEWLESLAETGIVGEQSVDSDSLPLEYLTSDGLRWLANERGVDVSDLNRKQDIIEALEG